MGLSNNISTYLDIKRVLDTALAADGARFVPKKDGEPSPGTAKHWVHRANKLRKLLQDLDAETNNRIGQSAYDGMSFRTDGTAVIITCSVDVEGDLYDLHGVPLEYAASTRPSVEVQDELLAKAIARRKHLGIDE